MNRYSVAVAVLLVVVAANSATADGYATRTYTVPQYGVPGGALAEPAPAHMRRVFRRPFEDTAERSVTSSRRTASSTGAHTLRTLGYSGAGSYGYGASGFTGQSLYAYPGFTTTTGRGPLVRSSETGVSDEARRRYDRYQSTRYRQGSHRRSSGWGTSWGRSPGCAGDGYGRGHGTDTTLVLPYTYYAPRTRWDYSSPVYYYPYNVIRGSAGSFSFQLVW